MTGRKHRRDRIEQAAALARAGLTRGEISSRMGVAGPYVSQMLSAARRRGLLEREFTLPGQSRVRVAMNEAEDAKCPRCSLRGEHECIAPVWWYAAARRDAA